MVGKLAAGIQLGILLVEHGGKPFYVEENYVCCDDSFDDDNGHGSACAYTIKSIFPETQFYIIKILDQNLETVYPVLEAALEHCMDLKYHIINLSLSLLTDMLLENFGDVH